MKKLTTILLALSVQQAFAEEPIENTPIKAVSENNYSISLDGIWNDVDLYTFQADGTFSLGQYFGASIGANAVHADSDYHDSDIQNLRASLFARSPHIGRIEFSYQNIFTSDNDEDFYGITGEYYFENWTLGAYFLSDDLDDLDDLNIYSNIYFSETIRLEVDLLDASDNSLLKGTVQFQLPELTGNEWLFNVSYGEDFIGDSQIGIGVKYVPNYSGDLKEYYRSFSTNIKSAFFN